MFDPHPFSAALAGPASVPEVAKHFSLSFCPRRKAWPPETMVNGRVLSSSSLLDQLG